MKKKIGIAIITLLIILLVASVSGFLVLYRLQPYWFATPADSSDIKVTTGFEYREGRYLDQRFFIEFEHTDGKPLQIHHENDYDDNGYRIGYTLTIRETTYDLFDTADTAYTKGMGYAYCDHGEPLPEDLDFIITVVYEDKVVKYSMVEEGLFMPQNTIVRKQN